MEPPFQQWWELAHIQTQKLHSRSCPKTVKQYSHKQIPCTKQRLGDTAYCTKPLKPFVDRTQLPTAGVIYLRYIKPRPLYVRNLFDLKTRLNCCNTANSFRLKVKPIVFTFSLFPFPYLKQEVYSVLQSGKATPVIGSRIYSPSVRERITSSQTGVSC